MDFITFIYQEDNVFINNDFHLISKFSFFHTELFFNAVKSGNSEIVKLIIYRNDIKINYGMSFILNLIFFNEKPLHAATNNGDLNMIKILMSKKGIDANLVSIVCFTF